jgi:hypothetical protein
VLRLGTQGIRHLIHGQPGGGGLLAEQLLHQLRGERQTVLLADGAQDQGDPQPLLDLVPGSAILQPPGERLLLLLVGEVELEQGTALAGAPAAADLLVDEPSGDLHLGP